MCRVLAEDYVAFVRRRLGFRYDSSRSVIVYSLNGKPKAKQSMAGSEVKKAIAELAAKDENVQSIDDDGLWTLFKVSTPNLASHRKVCAIMTTAAGRAFVCRKHHPRNGQMHSGSVQS